MQALLFNWLMLVGISHTILGIVVVLVAHSEWVSPYFQHLFHAFALTPTPASESLIRSLVQLFGPTVASWGLLFCLAVYQYRTFGTPAIKQLMIAALLIWFVIDCGLSLMKGIYGHLIINTLAAIAILPPLLLLKPTSKESDETTSAEAHPTRK
ncbi:hypothetical protein [Litoribacillus peritrichatus]|uniref:Uncharacterized protein n=1 Tax=Litoribacillus peritrichatus TaxID=718191 RepID=A0ABP7MTM7_9GAMM